jgi:hypothetical protein
MKKNTNQNKRSQRPQKKSRPRPRARKSPTQVSVKLPDCTTSYLRALSDPFRLSELACIPDSHVVPSKKGKFILRGTGSTGDNTFGYAIMNPFHVANDLMESIEAGQNLGFGCLAVTNGSANVGNISTFAGLTTSNGVTAYPLLKSPYALAAFDQSPNGTNNATTVGAQARVVGAGLRLRFTGTNLNKGGTAILVRREDGESIYGFSYDQLASRDNTIAKPLGDGWHEITYLPVQPHDYDYCRNGALGAEPINGDPLSVHATAIVDTRHATGILVRSAAPSQPFDWEYVVHVEFLGKLIDSVTKSHSDITGMSHVRNAIASAPANSLPAGPGFYKTLMTSIQKEITASVPQLISAGVKYIL